MKRGFTLAEILTVIVVLGVLAAVAIPSWRQHVLRTRRAAAHELLLKLQVAQEDFFGRNARYATSEELSLLPPAGLGLPAVSAESNYRLEIATAPDGLAFEATARAASGQSDDTHCATFGIDHLGMRTARDAAGADRSMDCWR
jgi:type IV pilus assembly protein PilE